MKARNPLNTDRDFFCDPSETDLFIQGLSAAFEGNMKETFGRVIVRNNWHDFAIGLSLHEDHRTAFRGSWALEWAYYNDKNAFRPHTRKFLDHFLKTDDPSVHRIYTKMLLDMYHHGVVVLSGDQAEAVAEKTFGLLIEADTRSAVKAWCMEILFELSPRLDWVEEPLREVVCRIMEDDPSKSMAKSAAKLIKRIDNRRK